LTKMPVHVPVFQFNPQTGSRTPLYEVTEREIHQQLLPRGFPQTTVYAYGGRVTTRDGAPSYDSVAADSSIRTAFATPLAALEVQSNQPVFVHYRNELRGVHMFPVDPTIMPANVNMAPT